MFRLRTSGKEPRRSIYKGEAKPGRYLDELPLYHIQADKSHLLLLVSPGPTARGFILVRAVSLATHQRPLVAATHRGV